MKVISLWQPWATLVAVGAKQFETRSWSTTYRGPLAIHAAKRFTLDQLTISRTQPFSRALIEAGYLMAWELPLGCIIAVANLIDCLPTSMYYRKPHSDMLSENETEFGDFTPGRYAWQLADIRRLAEPIPYRGQQGLWTLEPEVVAAIAADKRQE